MNDQTTSRTNPLPTPATEQNMEPIRPSSASTSVRPDFGAQVAEQLRVLVVAGIAAGVLVVGVGSRLAMFVLRLTSPDRVRGIKSDDDFIIGRFTLGGTYNLLMLGAGVGLVAAATYRSVSPWLIGPHWFRRFTIAAAAGAVGGSMLVHTDGIDYRLLKPLWLAIAMFVALPALLAVAVGAAVDRVAAADSWTRRGRRSWILPVAMIAVFPLSAFVAAFLAAWVVVWNALRLVVTSSRRIPSQRWADSAGGVPWPVGLAVRAGWLGVAVLGLVALAEDINGLT